MGHATRDLAIWNELTKLRPDVVTTFASYADGLKILSASKIDAIDLLL
jgi:hypothetical protein